MDPGERPPAMTGWTAARRRRLADQLAAEFASALTPDMQQPRVTPGRWTR